MTTDDDAFQAYLDVSAELGDIPPMVCLRHGRHVPCRQPEKDCLLTSDPDAVTAVADYQQGTDPDEAWDWRLQVMHWRERQEAKA